MKLAVSSYSFHRFGAGPEGKEQPPVSRMIERAAELGLDGIELLGVHLMSASRAELHELKRLAMRNGVVIVSVSANHNFVTPDVNQRHHAIDTVARCVEMASELGSPIVRAFGGRWNTLEWQEFMAASGVEPPRPGYSDDDAFKWSVDAFGISAFYAGRHGVTLAVENHWGLTGTAAGVLRLVEETDSPWMGVALDTGNFPYVGDMYAEMQKLVPYTVVVHAKTYVGGGMHYSIDLDYARIVGMLRQAGYRGFISIEHEGMAMPDDAIPESVSTLRRAIG